MNDYLPEAQVVDEAVPTITTIVSGCSASSAKLIKLPAQVDTFLVQYCLDCHDKQTMKGDLNLDFLEIDWADPLAIKTWSKALKMIESVRCLPRKRSNLLTKRFM